MPCGGCWCLGRVGSGRNPPGPTPVQHEGRSARRHCGDEHQRPDVRDAPTGSNPRCRTPIARPSLARAARRALRRTRTGPTRPGPTPTRPTPTARAAHWREARAGAGAGTPGRRSRAVLFDDTRTWQSRKSVKPLFGRRRARREAVEQLLRARHRRTGGARGSGPSPRTSRCRRCRRSRPQAPSRGRSRRRAASGRRSGGRPLHCSMKTLSYGSKPRAFTVNGAGLSGRRPSRRRRRRTVR